MRIHYVVFDSSSGLVIRNCSCPSDRLPDATEDGTRMIVLEGRIPPGRWKIDRRKARKPVTFAASLDSIASLIPLDAAVELENSRDLHIDMLDRGYADLIAAARGPLAALHAEKRRQAEAGGGPLVADESDRAAILANAATEDEAIAAIERERRAKKVLLRAATTEDEIKAALQVQQGPKEDFLT